MSTKKTMTDDELSEKLRTQLSKVFNDIENKKNEAIEFYKSANFNRFLTALKTIEPNTQHEYSGLTLDPPFKHLYQSDFDNFINLIKYQISPECSFYSETINFGRINHGFFFEGIETLEDIENSDHEKLQIQVDFLDDRNLVFIKRLDDNNRVIKGVNVAQDELFKLDGFTLNSGEQLEFLDGDSDTFNDYAKRAMHSELLQKF